MVETSNKNTQEIKNHTTKETDRAIESNQADNDKIRKAMDEHNDDRKADANKQHDKLDNLQETVNMLVHSMKKEPKPTAEVRFAPEATTIPSSSSSCGVESSSSTTTTCDSSSLDLSESTNGSREKIQQLEADNKRLKEEKLESELEKGRLQQELDLYTVPKKDCYTTPVRGRKRPSEREAASAAKHLEKQATGRAKRLEERNRKKFRYP